MPHANPIQVRDNIIKLLERHGGQRKRAVLFQRLWREQRPTIERALAFLEADELIASGELRQGKRGPATQYIWLIGKGHHRAAELNHKED